MRVTTSRQGRLIGRLLRRCPEALDDCISYVKLQALRQPGKADLGCPHRQNIRFVQAILGRFEPIELLYPRVTSLKGFYDGYSLGIYLLMNGAFFVRIYDLRPCNVIGSQRSSRICTE